jgi:Tail-tube assembly protein
MAQADRVYVDIANRKLSKRISDSEANKLRAGTYGSPVNLRYPNGSAGTVGKPPYEKWILFEVKSGRHILRDQILGEGGANLDRTLASVALYLPDTALNSELLVNWQSDVSLGGAAGALLDMTVQEAKGVKSAISNLQGDKSIWEIIKAEAGTLAGGVQALVSGALNATLSRVSEGVKKGAEALVEGGGDALEAFRGSVTNPRTDVLFRNVEFRTHTLTFNLVPRSKAEADEIDKILSLFQYYMLPSYGDSDPASLKIWNDNRYMIGYPYEFEIRMFSEFDELNKHHFNIIGRSVLKNISISSAPEGRVAFIEKNGEYYPVATTLGLQFQEVRLLGRDSAEIVRGGVQGFEDPRAPTQSLMTEGVPESSGVGNLPGTEVEPE